MWGWKHLALLAGVGLASAQPLASADIFDLGKLDQYKARVQNVPQLGGTTVWISGKEGDGFDIALSPDAKAKIQGVFDGCGDDANHCYQETHNVLHSANLQLDRAIESRAFADLLAKTFKKLSGLFIQIAFILYAEWKMKAAGGQEGNLFIPQGLAQKDPGLGSAAVVVVSAQGSDIGTVTPTADPTKLQGTQTPTVTLVTQPSGVFSKGDMAAILDADLAQRINDIMHMMVSCEDGAKFDAASKGGKRRRTRASGTYGQAVCAAEAVASMAGQGGPFNDLLLLNFGQMHFGFADAAGEGLRAANVISDFVLAYAPLIAIGPELANELGTFLLALAIDTIVDNAPLNRENRIAASLITTSPTTTPTPTQTGCPDPENDPLFCGYLDEFHPDCDVKLPDNEGGKPVCASGKYKGCECNTPIVVYEGLLTADQETFVREVWNAMAKGSTTPPSPPKPECQPEKFSDIPSNVFESPQNTVYGHFCDHWVKDLELKMTVDAAGNNRNPQPHLTQVSGRTPPPNPDTWSAHYSFDLSFEPTDKSKKCALDCNGAYSLMTNACSNTGTVGVLMAKTGKLDSGCGVFDYTIIGPTVPLAAQERHCFGADEFGSHKDIQGPTQSWYAGFACDKTDVKPVKRGDPSTNVHFGARDDKGAWYQFNIYWADGCVLDYNPISWDAIYPANPLAGAQPGDTNACRDLLVDNYRLCNNGGVGGSIQVGCLVYEFKPQPEK
ncbi:hypothetical protein B0T19DRAFT_434438 [Cercophora scortea]|uniref:Uncharacterized protein n=1 Tax=Cercophora scortea TaxID=314031 RepID=A0AAE0M3C3_9PEZI|nr:hypothetical protein B0T19DRAFT_434438 [Cercophora scortea]